MYLCYLHDTIPLGQVADLAIDMRDIEQIHWAVLMTCRHWGRKRTMLLAGILFDIGVVLTAGALNIYMLMAGRVLLGVAVAFASVSVTLYNSEMAPAQLRGRLNQLFQARPSVRSESCEVLTCAAHGTHSCHLVEAPHAQSHSWLNFCNRENEHPADT